MPAVRLTSIDWVRGIAVLIMIQAHVTDAWTHPADRTTMTYRYLGVLGGFAAPLFLWLAGLSLVLAGEAAVRQTGSVRQASRRLIQRGLEIFILAFVFRAHGYLFNPGGALLTLFRVDILNIMGPSMVAAGLVWGAVQSRPGQLAALGLGAVGIAMVTPVVRAAGWVDVLPIWFQWYLRPAAEHTVFTLFPWAGFVFAGSATGVLYATVRDARSGLRVRTILLAAGVAIAALGYFTAMLPTLYRESSFWTSSPTFFAVRAGILLCFLGTVDAAAAWLRSWDVQMVPLRRLGRASLLIYWVHVHLVYGWATAVVHRELTLRQLLVAYVAFCAAMYALIPIRDRLVALWQAQRVADRDQARVASV